MVILVVIALLVVVAVVATRLPARAGSDTGADFDPVRPDPAPPPDD